jgi:hypothetical protein
MVGLMMQYLLYMIPADTTSNPQDALVRDIELSADGARRKTLRKQDADGSYILIGQSGVADLFSANLMLSGTRMDLASLRSHICHVVGVRARKQMAMWAIISHARRIVTCMQRVNPRWQRADRDFEREPIGLDRSPVYAEPAVSPLTLRSQPRPAGIGIIRLVDVQPEALSWCQVTQMTTAQHMEPGRDWFATSACTQSGGIMPLHRAYSSVSDPGQLPLRRGHFMSRFYHESLDPVGSD